MHGYEIECSNKRKSGEALHTPNITERDESEEAEHRSYNAIIDFHFFLHIYLDFMVYKWLLNKRFSGITTK